MFIFSRWADLNNPLWLAPGWWFWDSWLFHGLVWFIDFLWLAGVAIRLAISLLFTIMQVLWAALTLIFWAVSGFINFYIGLFFLELRIDLTFFGPLLLFFGSYILWLFWPEVSCFIENVVFPYLRNLFVFWNLGFKIILLLYNLIVRVWNDFVPMIGMIIYVVIEFVATFVTYIVRLVGEIDVFGIYEELIKIMLPFVELFMEIIQAFISQPESNIEEVAVQIGPVLGLFFEVNAILFEIFFWLIRVLFFVLPPILTLVVKVVNFAQSHFFVLAMARRVLLSVNEESKSPRSGPQSYSKNDDFEQDVFSSMGHSANKYWTDESLHRAEQHLSGMLDWQQSHQSHGFDYYRTVRRPFLSHHLRSGRNLFSDGLPEGFMVEDEEEDIHRKTKWTPFSEHDHTLDDFAFSHRSYAEEEEEDVMYESLRMIKEEMHKKMPCKSKHCGGTSRVLSHPLRVIQEDHENANIHRNRPKASAEEHKNKFITGKME